MQVPVTRLKLFFLGLFALGCAGVWAYQVFYVWPRDRCESRGAWWDPKTRICATPIFLPKITGRPLGSPPLNSGPPPEVAAQSAPRVAPGAQSTSPAP